MAIDLADGRPWVLLPGTLCTSAVFDKFLNELGVSRASRHVISMCHPCVEDYVDDLQNVTEPNAVICGFSLGAMVAAHVADRIQASRFLFFGLNPYADDPIKRDGRNALAKDVIRLGGGPALNSRLPELAGIEPEQSRAFVLSMADESAQYISAQTSLALNRPGAIASLAHTDASVTLLTGSLDLQTPFSLAEAAARAAKRGRAIELAGLGHYSLVEDPVKCSRAVTASLNFE